MVDDFGHKAEGVGSSANVETVATSDHGKPETQSPKSIKRFIPIAMVVLGFGLFFAVGFQDLLSFDSLAQNRVAILAWIHANDVLAVLAFMVAYVVATSLSLPGGIWLTVAGGFFFGGVPATGYVMVAATLGATVFFLAARYAFADLCTARAGTALAKMEDGFRKDAFVYLLFLRLVPLFPFWLVNLVPALLDVKLRTFVIATFFGIIPGTFVLTNAGAGLGVVLEEGGKPDPWSILVNPSVLLPILGLAALSLIPVVYRKVKNKMAT